MQSKCKWRTFCKRSARTHAGSGAAERRRAEGARAVMPSVLVRYCCIDLQLARGREEGPEPTARLERGPSWRKHAAAASNQKRRGVGARRNIPQHIGVYATPTSARQTV